MKNKCLYKRIVGLENSGKVFLTSCGYVINEKSVRSKKEPSKREYTIFSTNFCTRCGEELSFSKDNYEIYTLKEL